MTPDKKIYLDQLNCNYPAKLQIEIQEKQKIFSVETTWSKSTYIFFEVHPTFSSHGFVAR